MSNLTIEAGKSYRMGNGFKAKATEMVRGCIIGYFDDLQTICPSKWEKDGRHISCHPGLAIVAPWSDPPVVDWNRFPKHIVAVAMDSNGEWRGFLELPVLADYTWRYSSAIYLPYHTCFSLQSADFPVFSGDWRDSLAVRPEYVSEAEVSVLDREAEEYERKQNEREF